MDTTTLIEIVIAAVVILIVGGLLAIMFYRYQRSRNLRKRFGPEYDRMVNKLGDKSEAEAELRDRMEHVKGLDLQPLSREQKSQFADAWRRTQAMFVDQPSKAIREANQLVMEVMSAKGYPVNDPQQRMEDLSVNYPDLISDYRQVTEMAARNSRDGLSTEEMRQAMIHCRALFNRMLGSEMVQTNRQKEKVT
jgi:hypothetical protein